jgi:hypothetical protein
MEKFNREPATQPRRPWEPPAVTIIGTIGQVLEAGAGKLSIVADDMGDAPFKPKGQE